jgi:mannose-1-phosphate guanylyltransferase
MLYAVIMAGGSGTRLWPLSRQDQPKQALKLIGERTMFQHTVDRLAPLFPPERIFVISNAVMTSLLRTQTPEIPADNFLVEPSGRNTAPAAGLVAIHLLHQDPDAVMVMLTADHYIVDTARFRDTLAAANKIAVDGPIVTLGIQPTYPATGYGYIRSGDARITVDGFQVYESAGFIEKPDLTKAVQFLEDGRYTWNSGMFVWRADRLMQECAERLPNLYQPLMQIAEALDTPAAADVLAEAWNQVPKVSIDYGIMEDADNVAVIPVQIGWSDIGSWSALQDLLPEDLDSNVVTGDGRTLALDTRGCFVRTSDRLVATIGLEDVIIVDTPDAVLVCNKSRAEDVKGIVEQLVSEKDLLHL